MRMPRSAPIKSPAAEMNAGQNSAGVPENLRSRETSFNPRLVLSTLILSIFPLLQKHSPGDAWPDFSLRIIEDDFHPHESAGRVHHGRNKKDRSAEILHAIARFDFQFNGLTGLEKIARFRFDIADEVTLARVDQAHKSLLRLTSFTHIEHHCGDGSVERRNNEAPL